VSGGLIIDHKALIISAVSRSFSYVANASNHPTIDHANPSIRCERSTCVRDAGGQRSPTNLCEQGSAGPPAFNAPHSKIPASVSYECVCIPARPLSSPHPTDFTRKCCHGYAFPETRIHESISQTGLCRLSRCRMAGKILRSHHSGPSGLESPCGLHPLQPCEARFC